MGYIKICQMDISNICPLSFRIYNSRTNTVTYYHKIDKWLIGSYTRSDAEFYVNTKVYHKDYSGFLYKANL